MELIDLKQDFIEDLIQHYGTEHQLLKVVEELNELAVEIIKLVNDGNQANTILLERADVEITLRQLDTICGFTNQDINHAVLIKTSRQEERMKHENETPR